MKHIEIVLDRLKQGSHTKKRSKCSFFKKELHYLGHLIKTDSSKPQREKVKAILDLRTPTTQKGVREIWVWLDTIENLLTDLLMQPDP